MSADDMRQWMDEGGALGLELRHAFEELVARKVKALVAALAGQGGVKLSDLPMPEAAERVIPSALWPCPGYSEADCPVVGKRGWLESLDLYQTVNCVKCDKEWPWPKGLVPPTRPCADCLAARPDAKPGYEYGEWRRPTYGDDYQTRDGLVVRYYGHGDIDLGIDGYDDGRRWIMVKVEKAQGITVCPKCKKVIEVSGGSPSVVYWANGPCLVCRVEELERKDADG